MASALKDEQSAVVQAAWRRYWVLLLGVALTVAIAIIAVWPWPYVVCVERFMLPQYESPFGFRGDQVATHPGDGVHTVYAVVEVVPGGLMARAGVKPGDIPIGRHGGLDYLYVALQKANSGEEGRFDVLAVSDWPDWSKRRHILLLPRLATGTE